jgi:hypothetical protein
MSPKVPVVDDGHRIDRPDIVLAQKPWRVPFSVCSFFSYSKRSRFEVLLPAFLLQGMFAFLLLFTLAFIFFSLVAHFDPFSLVGFSKGN